MAHKRRPEFCNRAGSRSRYAILHQPDLCRARSFHPAPSNRADSRSKSIRNRSGSPVVGNYSRSPAAAAGNTAPWRARVCQTRLRQGSQQPRVLNKKGDEMCTTFSGLDLSPAARSHVTVTQHTSRISLGADRNNHSTGRTGGSKGPLRLGATWPRRRRDVEGLFAICNSIPSM